MLDEKLLDSYECVGGDLTKTRELFEAEMARNKADGETVLGMTDSYDSVSQ
jgi:hypothetical protein